MTSVDEFLRRVITVINSNDPVARALTLRVLGAIAPIIAERKSVHHKVRENSAENLGQNSSYYSYLAFTISIIDVLSQYSPAQVRCSLDSQDQVELLAGIFAAGKLAATSSTFATVNRAL